MLEYAHTCMVDKIIKQDKTVISHDSLTTSNVGDKQQFCDVSFILCYVIQSPILVFRLETNIIRGQYGSYSCGFLI